MSDTNQDLVKVQNILEEVKALATSTAASEAEKREKLGKAVGELSTKFGNMESAAKEAADNQKRLELMLANAEANGSNETKTVDWAGEAKSINMALHGKRGAESFTPEMAKSYHAAFFTLAAKGGVGNEAKLSADEVKSIVLGQDSQGGYLVPPQFERKINNWVLETSPVRELANVMTIGSNSIEFAVDPAGFDADFVAEGAAGSQNTPAFDKVKIDVHRIPASPLVSIEMLDDNQVNLEQWMGERVAQRFAQMENRYYVTGDGNKKPRGFTAYDDGTTFGKVEQLATSAANTIKWLDLINLNGLIKEQYAARATIGIKRQTWFRLLTEQAATSGEYQIELDVLLMGARPVFNFMGTPVRFFQDFSTLAATPTTGVIAAVIADFREAYQIVDRAGISLLRNPYSNEGFVKFQFNKRTGGGVKNHEAIKLLKIA